VEAAAAGLPSGIEALTGLRGLGTVLVNNPRCCSPSGWCSSTAGSRASRLRCGRRCARCGETSLAAAVAIFLLMGLGSSGVVAESTVMAVPCMFLIPLGMGIAVLRDDAFDLDLLVRRTLLYAGASAAITAAVAGLAALVGVAAGRTLPLGAAVVLAVAATLALAPLRRRLERLAGRWAFGRRVGGYDVMTQVGAALEHAYELDELAPRLATMVQNGLGVRWVQVLVVLDPALPRALEPLGVAGAVDGPAARSLPLVHAGLPVGVLECGDRADGSSRPRTTRSSPTSSGKRRWRCTTPDWPQSWPGAWSRSACRAADLAASRARLVQAQEVERRRLERDLHDGAQQEIVALMAKLRLARNRLSRGHQDGLEDLLEEVQGDARGLLEELRELAHGIRPPVLADRGLVGAVESRAARLPLDVEIDAHGAFDRAATTTTWRAQPGSRSPSCAPTR
jgi:signal transduction histidine kinase